MPGFDAPGPNVVGPDVAAAGASLVPGRLIGARYELIRPIARGGMAEVWEGQDAILCRAVAIKVLQTHLAADTTFVERFRREAVTAARVAHPCVVATYDAGVDDGTAYIVMELVQGQTLRQLLTASAPLDPGLAVAIALQVADALADAHRAGLVHRDIKPANILLCDDGGGSLRVKVTDFGIAKVGADLGADLTVAGTVLGTPKYLSPEQVEGTVEPDARSDLYSLGVVLFEMLTGRPPFSGRNEMATALSHLREPPPRVSMLRPEISPGLDLLVAGMLAKAPADRPPTALAVRLALDELVRQGLTSPPPGAAARRPPAPSPGPSPARRRDPTMAPFPPAPFPARRVEVDGEGRPPALSQPVGNDAWRRGATSPYDRAAHDRSPDDRSPDDRTPYDRASQDRASYERNPYNRIPPSAPPSVSQVDGTQVTAGRRAPSDRPRSGPLPSSPPRTTRAGPTPASVGRPPRRGRLPGLLVAAIVLVAVIVAAILIADHGGAGRRAVGTASPVSIRSVTVWMNTTAHSPDNPGQTGYAYDGNLATAWQTDLYTAPHAAEFGGLYSGEGLAIHLTGTRTLNQLTVQSPTRGWAASTYVAAAEPPNGSPVTAWGVPTASAGHIPGNVTFGLGGRSGEWVLLWLTNLGPAARAGIAEITLR